MDKRGRCALTDGEAIVTQLSDPAFHLVALLVGEQLLAYSASYHVTPGGPR